MPTLMSQAGLEAGESDGLDLLKGDGWERHFHLKTDLYEKKDAAGEVRIWAREGRKQQTD